MKANVSPNEESDMAVPEIAVDPSSEIPRFDMDESPVPEGGALMQDICYVMGQVEGNL